MWHGSVVPGRAVGVAARVSRRLGLYREARALYRVLDPGVRKRIETQRRFYGRFVHQGALVFDVGANKGQKTEIFRLLGARVVAVEPNPGAIEVLEAAVRKDPEVEIVAAAVGMEPGRAILHAEGTQSTASLRSDWQYFDYGKGREFEVDVVTLDMLVERFGAPDFCKIDVEGFEVEVVRGLGRRLPCLSIEFHLQELERLFASIDHLARLGRVEVNVIEMEGDRLRFREWLAPDRLKAEIPSAGIEDGDVFVRAVQD